MPADPTPLLSREGANVRIVSPWHEPAASGGDYGEEGFVYQEYAPLPDFGGHRPVIGSWMVGRSRRGWGSASPPAPSPTT